MELMPHVKALFDDLLKMTSKIIVKRPDIATQDNNENNMFNLELYYAYRDIVNNEETVSSYSTIPRSVLETLVSWTQLSTKDLYPKAFPGTGHITPCEACNSTDTGAMKVVASGAIAANNEINLFDIDITAQIDSYVRYKNEPTKYFAYRQPTPSDQLAAGTLWLQKISKEQYVLLHSTNGTGKKLSFTFTRNGVTTDEIPDDGTYTDNSTHKLCIPYVNEVYIDETEIDIPTKDIYGNTLISAGDERYVYDIIAGNYYTVSGEQNDNVYKRYYSYGFYYTEPVIVNENIYVTSAEYTANQYKYDVLGGPYMLQDSQYVLPTEEVMNELIAAGTIPTAYYRVNEITRNAGNAITHVQTNTSASFGAFSIGDTSVTSLYYYVESESGAYKYVSGDYVIADVDDPGMRYTKVEAPSNIDRYTLSNGDYIRSANGAYTYICEDSILWIAQSVINDSEMSNTTNIGTLKPDYWPAAMAAMKEYILTNYCPNTNLEDHRVALYIGETNPYYRMLNGLPNETQKVTAPKIDRNLINASYSGTNTNPYVWELTDQEIETITENGMLDSIKALHPTDEYLNYLGRNRIDVISARDALPFEILRMQDVENTKHIELFKKAYTKAKDYVLNRFYNPEIFHEFDKYIGYIGFLIMTNAVCMCLSQSNDILIYDQYLDDDTINAIIKSYGFEGEFASLPTIYRKMLAKNILMLLKYRGTDDIYKIIYNICGITKYNIFKYDIVNGEDVVSVIRRSVIDHEVDSTNSETINSLINDDSLWKAGVEAIRALNFSKSSSKYIDMETYFDLSELTLNNSYLLNYLLDVSKSRDVDIDVPNVGIYKLFDLIVALFAIQSIKFGYSGTIPTSVASAASIYKFDLTQVANGDTEAKQILNTYASQLSGVPRENIDYLIKLINRDGSAFLPEKNDTTVRSFAEGYFNSVKQDSPNTNLNENSFYSEILELRSKAKNHIEYKCYNELLDCIASATVTANNFKLPNPVWEPIFAGTYTGSLSSYVSSLMTGTWSYGEDLSAVYPDILDVSNYTMNETSWVTDNDTYSIAYGIEPPGYVDGDSHISPNRDNFYLMITENTNGIYKITLYQKCYIALTYPMYLREKCPELYNKIYTITTSNSYVIDIYDSVFSVTTDFIHVYKDNNKTIIDLGESSNYTLEDSDSDGDIDLIILRDGTELTYAQYYALLKENADRIYKLIIGKIESMLSTDQIRQNLVLSHESTNNIMRYLELLINIFKSYNTQIHQNKVIYLLDEKNRNAVRLFDTIYFDLHLNKSLTLNLMDELEFNLE